MAKSQTCFSKDADMDNWVKEKVNSWCYDLRIERDISKQTHKYFRYRDILMALYELELINDFEYQKYSNELRDVTTVIASQMLRWRN